MALTKTKRNGVLRLSTINFYCYLFLHLETCSSGTADAVNATLDSSQLELQLVQVLFRHGDRNPTRTYPNDPYSESVWHEGLGQLTKVGKMQQYELGQYLKQRYKGFLSAAYLAYEIRVDSSDVDRTLMSAEANLAGLFPPKIRWKSDLDWQPIPVHTQPTDIDNMLKMDAPCPYYDQLYEDFLTNSAVMKTINAENEDLYKYLETHSGRIVRSPDDILTLYDILLVQRLNNYTLPNWTQPVFTGSNSQMYNLTTFRFAMPTYTTEMKRLKGGPLLKRMIQNIRNRIDKDERRKMYMYSAHDSTIAAFLNTLSVFDPQFPPYASLVAVELFENKSTEGLYVQVSYRNDTAMPPFVLKIPGCEEFCPFDSFVELTKMVVPVNWRTECRESTNYSTLAIIEVLATAGVLGVVLLLTYLSNLYSRKLYKDKSFQDTKTPRWQSDYGALDTKNRKEIQ